MKNYKNNRRRFRNNSHDRNLKISPSDQSFNTGIGNVSDFKRKSFNRNNFNTSKLIQKYSDLAREALSVGDKILYENYLQHAEHFIRISESYNNSNNLKTNNSTEIKEIKIENIKDDKIEKQKELHIEEN